MFIFIEYTRKGNKWAKISKRLALSVYARSPSAIEAIAKYNCLVLPSMSWLKKKSQQFLYGEGKNIYELKILFIIINLLYRSK